MAGGTSSKPAKARAELNHVASRDEAPYVEAAWLYYHDGLNQNEIADRMQVSRATVVNYLNEVRKRDWVRVYLDSDVFLEHKLAEKLCKAYGLSEALITPDDPSDPSASSTRAVRAAADWLPRLLTPGDRLGVSWGATVYQMAQSVAYHPIDDLTVVQLLGSRPAALGFAAEACTSMLAQKLGGQCINLHVPLLLSSKSIRDTLCQEPVVAEQLAALASCNKTVLACGTCDEDAHVVRTGILNASSVARYRDKGAAGVICGRLIDTEGAPLVAEVEDRMIGVSLDQMRGKEMALLIAAGAGRAASARAAILGGYVTHIATSNSIARELLEMAP